VLVIVGAISYLAVTGVEANKSYYVTIQELQSMGGKAYTRNLRVAGSVAPGEYRAPTDRMRRSRWWSWTAS